MKTLRVTMPLSSVPSDIPDRLRTFLAHGVDEKDIEADALWAWNSVRERHGHKPIRAMPKGTNYQLEKFWR